MIAVERVRALRDRKEAAWRKIAVPPRIENHKKVTSVGTRRTPATNSRIVLPREMRAMKTPTNGAHDIHQPQ